MNFSIHIDDNNIIRFITVERVESSVDYLCWKTEKGQNKSTNHLDDIWHWVWFCSGEGGWQRNCGGIGKCVKICDHYVNEKSLNPLDMYKCSVRIITKVMLSEVDTEYPVRLIIEGNHVPQNVIQEITIPSRINLSQEARDLHELKNLYSSQNSICNDIKLRQFIERDNSRTRSQVGPWTTVHELVNSVLKQKGVVLYYQQADINASEDSSNRYYQLTLSDDLWLEQARDCGSFCFGIDGKYDLNTDRAPVLSLVVEDNAGYETPIAFGISNKENNHTIRLTVEAVQRNIPCNNADCLHEYYYKEITNGLGGRSRDKEEALKLGKAYQSFIKSLPLTENAKESLCNDIFANWLSEEWINSFIDGGRMPSADDRPGIKPMTTNNLTE
ncbi:hypothetical protein C2G38_2174116 [Gigaspora rosea]|uniref:Uncharacterized protein n=1 Tax=Gigaspora rosea TaxID=44941 RepID=A0A397VKM4_9GLOM|nr:hypothetical protein C2G38_2174116 [Gigaspora rosea]